VETKLARPYLSYQSPDPFGTKTDAILPASLFGAVLRWSPMTPSNSAEHTTLSHCYADQAGTSLLAL
jgi:hypothetical protein